MVSCTGTDPAEGEMAVSAHEEALSQERTLPAGASLDMTKLLIWAGAAVLPWTAIIAGIRLIVSALG
jgi:hypothetical protein